MIDVLILDQRILQIRPVLDFPSLNVKVTNQEKKLDSIHFIVLKQSVKSDNTQRRGI